MRISTGGISGSGKRRPIMSRVFIGLVTFVAIMISMVTCQGNMADVLETTTRQMMMQQFFSEERVRSEGSSGIKQIRTGVRGTKDYFTASHVGKSMFAMHDHSNNIRTVGMGEFAAVLNGVEFRTRHNDYRLYQPHSTKKDFHSVEDIPFPDIPPEVVQKKTLDEKIVEMREWFKAWRDQNSAVRDYRKYFQPVMCYLEGAWTTSTRKIDEPFHSDRHFIDAKSWLELQEKVRFTSYTGSKSRLENLAFLPTTIVGFNGSIPHFAQWNYRIMCHKLSRDLATNRFRPVDDLTYRMTTGASMEKFEHSRGARFQLNSVDKDTWFERPIRRDFLDQLMEECPGKDNYHGNLTDEGLDADVLNVHDGKVKDVSKYHRIYKVASKDAMGRQIQTRGFSDPNMFAAMNTQDRVAGFDLKKCKRRQCHTLNQKWSYAIPLEIIYLTPLNKWNPFNLEYKGDSKSVKGKTVTANKRYGSCKDPNKAYNGVHSRAYYLTPEEFYKGKEVGRDKADTSRGTKCVLDRNGKVKRTRASGTRIFFPYIPGVGVLRQRYPIAPIHGEGGAVWKEVNALKDIVLNPTKYKHMFSDSGTDETVGSSIIEFETSVSDSAKVDQHTHTFSLTDKELAQAKGGVSFEVESSMENGHMHSFILRYNSAKKQLEYKRCDNKFRCWDRHGRVLHVKA